MGRRAGGQGSWGEGLVMTMSVEKLFNIAKELISKLPVRKTDETFYDFVDVDSREKRETWFDVSQRLLELCTQSPSEKSFYFQYWAADALSGLGEFEKAIAIKPRIELGSRGAMQTDRLLTLKLAVGCEVTGRDITTLFGPKLTVFGRQNIARITEFLDIRVKQIHAQERRNLLVEWVEDAYCHPVGMPLFSGHASYILLKGQPDYHFSLSKTAEAVCTELMRDAENTFREEQDIPKIGEGWVAETALFYAIKQSFPQHNVVQHGRPAWLGRQHLDIFLPDLAVALEYQGEQHDRPVDFFGGEEAFARNVARDKKKLALCRKHGVRIIYVRDGYSLSDILADIEGFRKS
jgi:hypothetical protein